MRRTIWDFSDHLSTHLSSPPTTDLENPWCFPHVSLIDLLENGQTWAKFHKSTPWGDIWQRRIWSSWNPLTQGIPCPTVVSSVLERIFLCGKHLRTQEKPSICPNSPNFIQTMKQLIRVVWCKLRVLEPPPLTIDSSQNVLIIQLLPLSSWMSWQSTFSSSFPCCPPSLSTQYPLCHHPPTALLGCRPRTSILIWRRWFHSKSCSCFPPSMFNPNLLRVPWAMYQPHHFLDPPHHSSPWQHPRPPSWPQVLSPHPFPATQQHHSRSRLLSCLLHPDSGGMGCIQGIWPQVGKSYLITTSCPTHLHSLCTLSCSESWNPSSSPLSTTTTLLDVPADPCPAFHQVHTTSYSSRVAPRDPPYGPTTHSDWWDCLFSLPHHGAFSCQLPRVQVP